jgi:urease gamma subunit
VLTTIVQTKSMPENMRRTRLTTVEAVILYDDLVLARKVERGNLDEFMEKGKIVLQVDDVSVRAAWRPIKIHDDFGDSG